MAPKFGVGAGFGRVVRNRKRSLEGKLMAKIGRGEMTEVEREALNWVLDLAYDDTLNYLQTNSPNLDFGPEWPKIATNTARYCRAIAGMANYPGEQDRWECLADDYEASITPVVDPAFVEILGANIKRFLEHGHGEGE